MRILVLWSSLADYTVSCFRQLSMKPGVELFLVHQPKKPLAPFAEFDLSFCKEVHEDNDKDKSGLIRRCVSFNPDTVLMVSWNYPHYMSISKSCRKSGTYVLSSFDGQWEATIRQRLGILVSPFFLRPAIDNFFVPGDRQSSFARRLGYKNPLNGLYSANSSRYRNLDIVGREKKFLFVGRLIGIKGVDTLLQAYRLYRKETDRPWDLIVAGTGPLSSMFKDEPGVDLRGFVQPEDLPGLFKEATCFVLPSLREPWGLVVHEAAIAGLIVITSYKVGASTWFVRDGETGYIVTPDIESVKNALKTVSEKPEGKLRAMAMASRKLGEMWTEEKWADYLYENSVVRR